LRGTLSPRQLGHSQSRGVGGAGESGGVAGGGVHTGQAVGQDESHADFAGEVKLSLSLVSAEEAAAGTARATRAPVLKYSTREPGCSIQHTRAPVLNTAHVPLCCQPLPLNPNPKPQTPDPKPQTPNPKPQIPNPRPQTKTLNINININININPET